MWVARDITNKLWLFIDKPIRDKYVLGYWGCENACECMELDSKLFPDLKWEDEPIEVNLISTDNIDIELNDMFCQLCVDYKIPDSVADKLINIFKSNVGSKK